MSRVTSKKKISKLISKVPVFKCLFTSYFSMFRTLIFQTALIYKPAYMVIFKYLKFVTFTRLKAVLQFRPILF